MESRHSQRVECNKRGMKTHNILSCREEREEKRGEEEGSERDVKGVERERKHIVKNQRKRRKEIDR